MIEQGKKQLVWRPIKLPEILGPNHELLVTLIFGEDSGDSWSIDENLSEDSSMVYIGVIQFYLHTCRAYMYRPVLPA